MIRPRPLFRFLFLTNSFYRRCVSCVYIIYPVYPIYPIHCLAIEHYRALFHSISFYFALFPCSISAKFGTTEGSPRNTYKHFAVFHKVFVRGLFRLAQERTNRERHSWKCNFDTNKNQNKSNNHKKINI